MNIHRLHGSHFHLSDFERMVRMTLHDRNFWVMLLFLIMFAAFIIFVYSIEG